MAVFVVSALSILIIVFLVSISIPILRMERTIADLTDSIETKVQEYLENPNT